MESLQQAIIAARGVSFESKLNSKHLKPAVTPESREQKREREEWRHLQERIQRLEEKFEVLFDRLPAPTRDMVDRVEGEIPQAPRPVITMRLIKAVVAEKFQVSVVDMESQRRAKRIVYPRQIATYLAYHLTSMSYPEIGRRLGNRDHTTAMASVRRIDKWLLDKDPRTEEVVAELMTSIPERAAHESAPIPA